jgi:hypothetical protein
LKDERNSTGATAMASNALRLAAVLVLAASQTAVGGHALARGGGGGGASSGGHSAHMAHFNRPFLRHHFLRNQAVLGGWGWGWDWPYGDTGYSNTTIVFPQAIPQAATGTLAATPCHWNEDTFSVPSSAGGTRPVQAVTCR